MAQPNWRSKAKRLDDGFFAKRREKASHQERRGQSIELNSIVRLGTVASPFSSGNPAGTCKKERKMAWTVTNLAIQIVFGILGGHAAATATKEHNFGALGHTIVGAIGGGLSGFFLQTIAGTLVTGTGEVMASSPVEQAVIQGLTGAVVGGIAVLVVGMIKFGIDQHKTPTT